MDEAALIARYVERELNPWGSDEAHVIGDGPRLWILVQDMTTAPGHVPEVARTGRLPHTAAYSRMRAVLAQARTW
jgi:hypothetical protein